MDFSNMTLAGLAAVGVVNVLSFWKQELDPKIKFTASLVVAFGITFIPADLGNVLLTHAKDAITIAFSASGVYKLFSKMGGN